MKDFDKLKTSVANLLYAETWITVTGLAAVEVVAFGATQWLLSFFEIPSLEKLWIILHVLALAALGWCLGRYVYWRWGFGRKVGVSFDLYRRPMEEWAEARADLSRLCQSYSREQKIRLKLLPPSMTKTPEAIEKTKKRFNMPIVIRVNMSSRIEKPDQPIMAVTYSVSFGAEVVNHFLQVTGEHAKKLFQREQPESARQALQYQAAGLFELILLYLAVIDHVNGEHERAARFLQRLDDCIQDRFRPDQQPRKDFRWLAALCLTKLSSFAGDKPPEPDELLQCQSLSQEAAEKYGKEFPHVYNALARNLYYVGDIAGAMAVTDAALALPPAHDEPVRACAILNRAVLSLFQNNYADAVKAFDAFVATGQLRAFQWRNDLLKFADQAYADGRPNAIFLKVLYRRVLGERIPKDLEQRFRKWVASDPARNELGVFYHARMPVLYQSKQQKQKGRRKKNKA